MLTFRQKIFLSYASVFVVLIALMFPFAAHTVHSLFNNVMEDHALEIIAKIQKAHDNSSLVRELRDQKSLFFYRISIISNEHKVLYDSHTKSILGSSFSQDYVISHPEVSQAFKSGIGYHEEYSKILGQRLSYLAKAFDFHGKTYIVRIAYPHKNVTEIIKEFEYGLLAIASTILMLFTLMTSFIINYLTSPIQKIVKVVKSYQDGAQSTLPMINVTSLNPTNEFEKLASTLNSLSEKIQKHINHLTVERNEKEAILESLIEGVIAVDADMIVTYANASALKLLNLPADELINLSLHQVQHSKYVALLTACQQKKTPLTDTTTIKHTDSKVFLDLVAAPKKENAGAILVLQDKSIHYKMLEMRKDFIANASHELKTPITVIQGFAETLQDAPHLPREMIEEITGKIVRNSQRMSNLVKDLLALSDIENLSEMRLVNIDILELIANCSMLVQDRFPDLSIELKQETKKSMQMVGDPNLLEMAIINLIENGAKYSNPPGQLTIVLEHLTDKLQISISDKGIGMPQADLEHIFERFYTVNKAHSRKMGGSGLGLSIVENVISKHHGKISVTSKIGEGTTFIMQLPIKPNRSLQMLT